MSHGRLNCVPQMRCLVADALCMVCDLLLIRWNHLLGHYPRRT